MIAVQVMGEPLLRISYLLKSRALDHVHYGGDVSGPASQLRRRPSRRTNIEISINGDITKVPPGPSTLR